MVEYCVPVVPKSSGSKKWKIVYYTVFSKENEIPIARTYGLRNLRPHITEEFQTFKIEKVLSGIILTGIAHLLIEENKHILHADVLVLREKKFIIAREKIPSSLFMPEEYILTISLIGNT